MPYFTLAEILDGNAVQPEVLDHNTFDYKGVTVNAYGFLHGVTGAPNAAYREFVRRTVPRAPGLVFGEMGLSRPGVGLGIKRELHDYAPVLPLHTFLLGFMMTAHPRVLTSIAVTAVKEIAFRHDPFGRKRMRNIVDLAHSPMIHALAPLERRRLFGFPQPAEYLRLNLKRCESPGANDGQLGPRFPDPNWAWLTVLERYVDIPVRSVHMLEYAVETARLEGADTVSLFVGELHPTDMAWYAENQTMEITDIERNDIRKVCKTAIGLANAHHAKRWASSRLKFSGYALLGALPVFVMVCCLIVWVSTGVLPRLAGAYLCAFFGAPLLGYLVDHVNESGRV